MGSVPIRVLLVEDTPEEAQALRDLLARVDSHPYQPSWVSCLSEALDQIRNAAFDVVLLDLTLPDSQGIEALRAVTAVAPGAPIVVLTNPGEESLTEHAVRHGAHDYLVKGHVDPGLLTRAIPRQEGEGQLREAQKLEAIGRLAGGVAHDFNNILAVVNGYAELLLDQGWLDARSRPAVEEIKRAAERATSLTRQLLAFSRRQ